mgnify:CR=1 FL=1
MERTLCAGRRGLPRLARAGSSNQRKGFNVCVWCGAIFVLITVRHRTYWSRRKNKADIQQKHNKQTQIGIGPRVAVSRVYGTGTHPTTMMQQRENTDSEYHTDGGARDSHVVAELHDLEGQNQSASLIHSDHAPDYNYPPDKCCCCCCNSCRRDPRRPPKPGE